MVLVLLLLLLNDALLTGNEFAVAAFIHPALSRHEPKAFLPAIQQFASLFGSIMPIWMGVTTGVHILVGAIAWFQAPTAFPWLLSAALIWTLTIPYSLLFPVPLNNQVQAWDLDHLPPDWETVRSRWDTFNALRVLLLIAAFLCLAIGFQMYA